MVPIAVVGIALAFLMVDVIVQMISAKRGKEVYGFFIPDPPERQSHVLPSFSRITACLNDFGIHPLPNAFLHRGHTWASVEKSGDAAVGVDALARRAIGKVDAVELPSVGQSVRRGECLFSVRQGARRADFVAPIGGTVVSVNENAASRLNADPSEWVCRIKPANLASDIKALRIAEEAVKWVYEELFRLHQLVAAQLPRLQTVGVTMQDGALSLDSLLESLDDEAWKMFEEEFLKDA
jgi:glycine cleavage system H protein